jgi:hypothetical protein
LIDDNGVVMTRSMPGFLPLVIAVVITVLFGGVSSVVDGSDGVASPVWGILVLFLLLAPYVLPVLWAWVLLKGQSPLGALFGAAVWLATGLAFLPQDVTWHLTTHVVTGLVAGFGLILRWKPGLILLLLALVVLPIGIWSLNQMPMDEIFEAQKEEVLKTRHELLLEGTRAGEEPPSLEQEEQVLDDLFATVLRLTPSAVALGLLAQAAVSFGLVWILVRAMGLASVLRGFPPFVRWRMPFAVVWILAAAVALLIVPLPIWPAAGLNLVMVVCAALAVQGAALQWHMSSSGVPMLLRLFFLFLAGMLFMPLVLLGLADQWLDIRKLDIEESDPSELSED